MRYSVLAPGKRLRPVLVIAGAEAVGGRADDVDGDAAVDLITELAELARQIEGELTRARDLADATG
jgi:geranylgeranyl pyrophosphate synthase